METIRSEHARYGIGVACVVAFGLLGACGSSSGGGNTDDGTGGTGPIIGSGGTGTGGMGTGGMGTGGKPGGTGGMGTGGMGTGGIGTGGMGTGGMGTGGMGTGGMGTGGMTAMSDGGMTDGGMTDGGMSDGGMKGSGDCCPTGDCLCHGPDPTALTSAMGPFKNDSYDLTGVGCVYYPTDADPPYAAVAISDGFGGSGGCGPTQTNDWGPLYASWGIVAMIVDTGAADTPDIRGMALTNGIAAFKKENTMSGSKLMGKLSGRYGTSGFSMGGGGTTYAAAADSTLKSSVGIMAWGPVTSGVMIPSLFICGDSDALAGCGGGAMGSGAYAGIADTVPKMIVTISSAHFGQPSGDNGKSGEYGLAFEKVFLEGDERWRPILVAAKSDMTTIK